MSHPTTSPPDCALNLQVSSPIVTDTVFRRWLRVPYPPDATFTVNALAQHFGVTPKRIRNELAKHRLNLDPLRKRPSTQERIVSSRDFDYLRTHVFYLWERLPVPRPRKDSDPAPNRPASARP